MGKHDQNILLAVLSGQTDHNPRINFLDPGAVIFNKDENLISRGISPEPIYEQGRIAGYFP